MSTVHVKGLSELKRFLDELPAKLERSVMRGGLRAGANVVKEAAKGNIRSDTGALANSLKVSTRARGGEVTAKVYTKVFYAKFVEYGTKPHTITAKEGALAFGGGVYKSVEHPGIVNPKPFMRPALDTQAQAAVVAVGTYIRDRLATKHGLETADIAIGEEDE